MRPFTSALVCLFLLTPSITNAATLSMRWKGTSSDRISLLGSESAVIEVVVELSPQGTDTLSGVIAVFEPIYLGSPLAPILDHVSNGTDLPNWSASGPVNQPFGEASFSAAAFSSADSITGAVTVVVGELTVHATGWIDFTTNDWEIAFNHESSGPRAQLFNDTGQPYGFVADSGLASTPGLFTYGKGSPGVQDGSGTNPRDPLIVFWSVPEPGSFVVLLVAGGTIALRRPTHEQKPSRMIGGQFVQTPL